MISKGLHIGPSPNWYLINVSDCNSEHVFAYGAKTNICLIEAANLPPTYCGLFVAHTDRVSILKFCRSPKHSSLLVSAAEDGRVKLWDIGTFKCLNEISSNQKISCVEWQGSREDTVFLSYEPGQLLKWKVDTEAAIPIKTAGKVSITSLSCCPRNTNLLAIGYRGGVIAILDVELGTINQKLKGHENDILSMSWAPHLLPSQQGCEALFSTSRDKSLRVWDVEQEKAHHVLYAPNQQLSYARRDELNKMRFFVAGSWLPSSTNQLLVGFPSGEISTLDLEDSSQHWVPLDSFEVGGHSRCIFNISITPDGKRAFSISLDRQIVIWDLENKKAIFSLATLGGFAYSLGFSPLERGRLAIGGGDNSLRAWNLTSSTKSCSTYWQGIKGKVTTLAWHPYKEGIVAFGTDEGRVAYLDTNTNKLPLCSSTYHRNTVYCIRWGPYLLNDHGLPQEESSLSTSLDLYSCGDGHIYIHSTSNLQREAHNFDHLVKKYVDHQNRPLQRTELAWKQDFTALAVGNEDGSIEVYSTYMVLLARLEGPKKLIQCLSWHPRYTGTSDQVSPLHGWLACASNENTIYVYDLARIIKEQGTTPVVVTEATRELIGHHFRVVALAWSPHCDARLASASYDATVQVWDVNGAEALANYQGHRGRLFCVEWSPLDPDIVFSGGEDSTVQQWHISHCDSKLPPLKEKNKSKKTSAVVGELELLLEQKKRELLLAHQFGPGGDHPAELGASDETSSMMVANGGIGDCGPLSKPNEDDIALESRRNSLSDDLSYLTPAKETKIAFSKSTKSSKFKKSDSSTEAKKTKKKAQKSYFPLTSNMDCSGKHRGQEDCIYLLNYFYPPKLEARLNKGSKKTSRKVSFSDSKSLLEDKSDSQEGSYLYYPDKDMVEDELFLLSNESNLSASSHDSHSDSKATHHQSASEEDQESKASNPSEEVSSVSEDNKAEGGAPSGELSYYSSSTTSLNTTHSDVEPGISALVEELVTYISQECPDSRSATVFPNEVEQTLPAPKRRPRLIRKSAVQPTKSTSQNCTSAAQAAPPPNLGFFLNNMSARKVLSMEATHHRDNANFDYYSQMEIWQGNIGNVLREAADQKKLNDLLVSLAPLGSTKLWREMCECYAQQLIGEGQYHKAVLYLLACHHVHKAVQVFRSHGLFREALALARARLSATDQAIHDIYLAWGNHADKEGNYELAAKCFLSIDLPVAASKVLAKRNDPSSVRVAGLIARRCNQADKAAMYAHAALREALLRGEYDLARDVCGDHPNMEGFLLLISLHREIVAQYDTLRLNPETAPEMAAGEGESPLSSAQYWREVRLEDGQLLTETAVVKWQQEVGSTCPSHISPRLVKSLSFKTPHLRNMKEILFKVSLDLFQEIVLSLQ